MEATNAGPSGDITPPLPLVCNFWKEFDLEGLRTNLDSVGLQIAAFQEESTSNRRQLAEETRNFKRMVSEEVGKHVAPLLKRYQEEVDRLTKRAKHGEAAFLDVYQKLYEALDPAPALTAALESTSYAADLEARCRKLTQELAEYKAESKEIKNQDLTIRKLEDKIKTLEIQLEQQEAAKAEAVEAAAAAADASALDDMRQREARLTEMLEHAQTSLATMQHLYQLNQNKLFEVQSHNEAAAAGQQSELEIVLQELERTQQRLLAAESEKHALMNKIIESEAAASKSAASLPSAATTTSLSEVAQLREELSIQRQLVASLREEVLKQQRQYDDGVDTWEARIAGLKRALEAQEAHSTALEQELASRPTAAAVEQLRSQIRTLQAVGGWLDTSDDVAEGNGTDGPSATAAAQHASVETALVKKMRHLEHELTMSKLETSELRQQYEACSSEVAQLRSELADKQHLVSRLEEDLYAAEQASKRTAMGLTAGQEGGPGEDAGEEGGGRTMVAVLCSQRDRLRHQVTTLEEELQRVRHDLQAAKSDVAAARADNVALVERLRFVQGYRDAQRQRGDVEQGLAVESKYARDYERSVDPFREFKGKEQESRRHRMGVADRAVYSFGQLVISNRYARLVAFGYLLALHLLVLMIMFRFTQHHSVHTTVAHSSLHAAQAQFQAAKAAVGLVSPPVANSLQ